MEMTEIGKSGDGFIDRSKVRILLCDNDGKRSEEVFTLLCKCSYQGFNLLFIFFIWKLFLKSFIILMILVCDICALDALILYLMVFLYEVVLIVLIPIFRVLTGIRKLEFFLLWIVKKHIHLPIVVFQGKYALTDKMGRIFLLYLMYI